jgi:3-oxoacyl-[acyl-carrier-protein] synthase-3
MNNRIKSAITGVHGYVPEFRLTNAELEKMVETSDEWITTRTGISERRILQGDGLGTSKMAIEAVNGLLAKTNTDPKNVELIICATVTPDYTFPATANIIADAVGAVNSFSFDINAACSGFIYSLITASQFIESGRYKKIIVIGADKMSSIIDYTDRTTCVIFGDGAGAVLLEPAQDENCIEDHILKSDGSGCKFLHKKAGGSKYPSTIRNFLEKEHFVYQDGPHVFKFAVVNMAEVSFEIMLRNRLTADDVTWLVPHQANKRIIDATASRMDLDEEKVMVNIHNYGNTTAGTIPLCLWDYESKLKKGDKLIISAFGGGFTWGAIYLKWAY